MKKTELFTEWFFWKPNTVLLWHCCVNPPLETFIFKNVPYAEANVILHTCTVCCVHVYVPNKCVTGVGQEWC